MQPQENNNNQTNQSETKNMISNTNSSKSSINVAKKYSLFHLVSWTETIIVMGLLLGNIVMFIFANTLNGADEYITVDVLNTEPLSMPIFSFSLESSFVLMNEAGAHAIAILILVLSAVWPYVKSIILAVMWFLPVHRTTREHTLWTIDLLGKWSFLDFFFMMILGICFMIDGGSNFLWLGLGILPDTGVYLFISSAIVNLAITQYCVHVHHRVMYGEDGIIRKSGRVSLVNNYVGKYAYLVVICVLDLLAVVLFFWGAVEPLFTFHYSGALTELITGTTNATYSLSNLGKTFPHAVYDKNSAGSVIFAILYYVFVFVAPLVLSIVIPLTWAAFVFERSAWIRYKMVNIVQIVAAWAAVDVFLVALGAGTTQLEVIVAQSIVEATDKYDIFGKPGFELVSKFCGSTSKDNIFHMTCLSVDTELRNGFYISLGSVLVFYILTIPTCLMLGPKIQKRDDLSESGPSKVDSEATPADIV